MQSTGSSANLCLFPANTTRPRDAPRRLLTSSCMYVRDYLCLCVCARSRMCACLCPCPCPCLCPCLCPCVCMCVCVRALERVHVTEGNKGRLCGTARTRVPWHQYGICMCLSLPCLSLTCHIPFLPQTSQICLFCPHISRPCFLVPCPVVALYI